MASDVEPTVKDELRAPGMTLSFVCGASGAVTGFTVAAGRSDWFIDSLSH